MKISLIVPARNEEENIVRLVGKIEDALRLEHELLIVDDHSTDKTRQCAQELCLRYGNLRVVENDLEAGFANALRKGFSEAGGEAVVPIMGDLCDDLTSIPPMLEKLESGFDVVCGSRYIQGGQRLGGSRLKGFLSKTAGRSLYYLLGIPTHDIANAFKMYRKTVIDGMKIESNGFEVSMEMALKAYYSGYRFTEIPTVWRERTKGKSNFRIVRLLPSYLKLYVWAIYKRLFR